MITTLPEEILTLILQSCTSFSQLTNLLLASKSTHAAWIHNQRSILWHVGQAAIPGFTDALIAVRATTIASESLLNGQLPPPDPFQFSSLSGSRNKPNLEDVNQIQNLAKLATYLERRTRCPRAKTPNFPPHKWHFDSLSWKHNNTWTLWRDGYHRAVYRYLTAGAVLSRTYFAPVVSSSGCSKKPRGFLNSLVTVLEGIEEARESEYPDWFSDRERAYLSTVAVYDSQGYERWGGEGFSALEEIFVRGSTSTSTTSTPTTTSSSSRKGVVSGRGIQPSEEQEEGLEKSLYGIFGTKAKNMQNLDPAHAEELFSQILQFLYLVDGDIRYLISLPGDTPREDEGEMMKIGSVNAILFGSFTPMRINIRRKEDGTEAAFATTLLPKLDSRMLNDSTTTREYLGFQNMHNYLQKVWDVGGIANCYDDPIRKTPPPVSFFVEYMLRKYFGLRFAVTMFDSTVENRCAWYAFHQFGGMFTGSGPSSWYVGQDLLQSVDDPIPTPCYDEYACYY
ncbi:hypothetical protein BDW59DRAFT_172546 [Aspergillus cavernicola]|uniref:F-box domain-containing protein n=1 Tax=Aspergillus cavernicola TaxID=176166 RepID=A0ABR4IDW9_9EURO